MASSTPAPATAPVDPKGSDTYPTQMAYEKLNELFGSTAGLGIFQMEFPARILDEGTYKYVGSDGINAQQVKPQTVAEAEFRLADDMYDIANVMNGPNGSSVAAQYQEALYSLVSSNSNATSSSDVALRDDQEKICAWLEEEVENFDPPFDDLLASLPEDASLGAKKPPKYTPVVSESRKRLYDPQVTKMIPRVDLYQKLFDLYNAEKLRWVEFKNNARPQDFSKQEQVEAYDRMLSTYAPVVDAKLESLWTVLLIRGQYHRVRRYVGYIDIDSASETLMQAKENLRASVARSIDDTEDIYPVVFSPSSWAKYLSTNFMPEDLLSDPATLRSELYQAELSRKFMIEQRNALLAGNQDISKLATAEDNARKDWNQTKMDMTSTTGLTDTGLKLVDLYFDAKTAGATDMISAIKKLDPVAMVSDMGPIMADAKLPALTLDAAKKLLGLQSSIVQKAANLQIASESYVRAQLASAQARSQPGVAYLDQLQTSIDNMTQSIQSYKSILASTPNPFSEVFTPTGQDAVQPNVPPKVPTTPDLPPDQQGASVWTEVTLTYTASKDVQTSFSSASASSSGSDDSFLFWGSDSSTSSSSATNSSSNDLTNTNVQIAFRAMKVSIQRPWMNPGIFDQSGNFFRTGATPISPGDASATKSDFDAFKYQSSGPSLFPSYATGFLVAKDVHIIYSTGNSFSSDYVKDMQSTTSSGGGFLFFSSGGGGSSSSSHTSKSVVTNDSTNVSIRIPAPQILGWFCELTPKDETVGTYTPLPGNEFEDSDGGLTAAVGKMGGVAGAPPSPPLTPGGGR